jgi:hypothetical protein
MPRRFRLDRGRDVEIIENVDQWHGRVGTSPKSRLALMTSEGPSEF